MSDLIFHKNSVLVLDSGNVHIVEGAVKLLPNDEMIPTTTQPVKTVVGITFQEVKELHDNGAVVYEQTDEFVGYWRQMVEVQHV